MFNKEGDRPRGYDYPSPSIKGGSIGAKPSGQFKQLTEDDLARVRKAATTGKNVRQNTRSTKKY